MALGMVFGDISQGVRVGMLCDVQVAAVAFGQFVGDSLFVVCLNLKPDARYWTVNSRWPSAVRHRSRAKMANAQQRGPLEQRVGPITQSFSIATQTPS